MLQLWQYAAVERIVRGRIARALEPLRRRTLDRSAAAAIFARFGFDKHGYMPSEVFIHGALSHRAILF